MGGAVVLSLSVSGEDQLDTFSTILSTRLEQNPYTAELIVIEEALKLLPDLLNYRVILIITNNKAAASAVS